MTSRGQFGQVQRVSEEVLADHALRQSSSKQAAWALLLEAKALTNQQQLEPAIEPLQMAIAIADPNHLDLKYMAQDELHRVYRGLVQQAYDAAKAALKDKDKVAARTHLEEAYHWLVPSGEDLLGQIAKELAKLAEAGGDLDRAIAWYRAMIPAPANLKGLAPDAVEAIARLCAAKHDTENELYWRRYLLDPGSIGDPTASLAAAVLGAPPPTASRSPVTDVAARHLAFGKLYLREHRSAEAKASLEQAYQIAGTPRDQAEALTYLVAVKRDLEGRAAAEGAADHAVDLWRQVIRQATWSGDAHHAIDMASEAYQNSGAPAKTLSFLEGLRSSIVPPAQDPSTACLARYRLMLEYECQRRDAEARAVGREIVDLFLNQPFVQGHSTLCGNTLIHLAYQDARAGDPVSARARLDEVGRRWPQEFRAKLAIHSSAVGNPLMFPRTTSAPEGVRP